MSRSLQVIGILIVIISIVGVASATVSVGNINDVPKRGSGVGPDPVICHL